MDELKPREKALKYGFDTLTDEELLALFIRTGNKQNSCFEMARILLEQTGGFSGLMELSLEDLMSIKGIGVAKASELLASVEVVKRISFEGLRKSESMDHPEKIIKWLQKTIGLEKQEFLMAIYVNSKGKIIGHKMIHKGTINDVSFAVSDVFEQAIRKHAYGILVAHNHPSQSVNPSLADDIATKTLKDAAVLLGIRFIDHLIVSYDEYYSYSEEKLL